MNTKRNTSGDSEAMPGYDTEDNSVKNASDMNGANQIREEGTTEKGCEISILLEKTPRVRPIIQEASTNKKEASSPNIVAATC